MHRREVLAFLASGTSVFLVGCNGRAEPEGTQPTATKTPWPDPTITSVSTAEVTYPDDENTILFRIEYQNLHPDGDYAIRLSLESAAGTRETTKEPERVQGYYPGFALMRLKPADGTAPRERNLEYTIRLSQGGTVLATRSGEITPE